MSDNKKIYWKGLEQLKNDPAFVKNAHQEFAETQQEDPGHSRRDFSLQSWRDTVFSA